MTTGELFIPFFTLFTLSLLSKIVCSLWFVVKSGVLWLIIRRGQSNYSIVFIFVSFEEKGYYCVVSVGHLIFDCRLYCGLSRRMQGEPRNQIQ